MNYKRLGDYIQPVNNRNKDLEVKTLLGVSVKKIFIPSIANTVGTDFKKYKIVKRHQFVYIPDTSRRGDKIGIAMLEEYENALVSQAYSVFEVKDQNKLLAEYLMMWFRRPEFDRYARYKSHGSVREIFDWDEVCDIKLPIPSIEKQQQIVDEYNTITNRIQLNEKINANLEATAQALYKHWFVDFEFPNEDGNPYKSSGGKMVYNEEVDKEIPVGWSVKKLENLIEDNPENISKEDNFKEILYLETSNITRNKIDGYKLLNLSEDSIPSRAKRKVKDNDIIYSTVRPALLHYGLIRNPPENLIVSTGFAVLRITDLNFTEVVYQFLISKEITKILQQKAEMSVSTYPSITADDILNLQIALPTENILGGFKVMNKKININNKQSQTLQEMQSLLLAKMTQVEPKPQAV